MRRRVLVPLVAAAIALEAVAISMAVSLQRPALLPVAILLHVAAAFASRMAARERRPELGKVEGDLVLVTGVFVPIFGPALGWTLPYRHVEEDEEIENAHVIFERYAEHVQPDIPDYERTVFTGNYERDVARELDTESYHEVLRHGSTDQKRNALRRLVELGEPRHLALVRGCLLDPEHEVRLYAYSELERAGREYEEIIATRSRQLERKPGNPEALLALARAQFDYADSGVHDEEMGAFYYRTAARFAVDARAAAPSEPDPIWIEARALARLRAYDEAVSCLERLTPEQQDLPESCVARADVAFCRRDFDTARDEACKIREQGAELPRWLQAIEEEPEDGEEDE